MNHYPDVSGPDPASSPALAQLLGQLRERHNNAVDAVLLYGSCRRSGDIHDGLLDLYLIVSSYRAACGPGALAVANWLLPPNVFYAECATDGRVLRGKITVISLADFRRGCSRGRFESYIWGRFSQPTRIIYAGTAALRRELEECLLEAARTLLHCSLPVLSRQGSLAGLWQQALSLSYGTELRTERSGRMREMVATDLEFYIRISRHLAASLAFPFAVYNENGDVYYRCDAAAGRRARAACAWQLRKVQGKLMSMLRLIKALFTFEAGLDYIAWKLERHSGQAISIPPRVRRYPLIFMWGFFWTLYRRGVFK